MKQGDTAFLKASRLFITAFSTFALVWGCGTQRPSKEDDHTSARAETVDVTIDRLFRAIGDGSNSQQREAILRLHELLLVKGADDMTGWKSAKAVRYYPYNVVEHDDGSRFLLPRTDRWRVLLKAIPHLIDAESDIRGKAWKVLVAVQPTADVSGHEELLTWWQETGKPTVTKHAGTD